MIRYSVLLLLLLACTGRIAAQGSLLFRGPTLGAGAQIALPQGTFSEHVTGTPVGLHAYLSMPFLGLPLETGLNFSWNRVDRSGSDVAFDDNSGIHRSGKLVVKQNIYRYMGSIRLRPFNKGFRPYGEVLGGLAHFSSKSEVTMNTYDGHEQKPVVKKMVSSLALTYGWAVGLQIRIIPAVFLEVRYERLQGNTAKYLNPRSLQIAPDGSYNYTSISSDTDVQTASLGLAFSF